MKLIDKCIKPKLTIFSVMFLIIFIIGFFPLIKNSYSLVWNIDGVGQYYPAFIYIGKYLQQFLSGILHGEWILPTFDLSIGLGEDIIGSLNYYGFGDPLNILAIFVTKNNSIILFSFMIVLRMWLSGIALIMYLKRFNIADGAAVLAALCYSFNGFILYGGLCYSEWISVAIFTPLILLGIEKILNGEKYTFFVLSVCYGGLCGFYFLFMTSMVLILYVPIRMIFRDQKKISNIIKLVIGYVVGVGISAPFFLPSVAAYMNSERKSSNVLNIIGDITNYKPMLKFNIIDYISNPFFKGIPYLNGVVLLELLAIFFLLFMPNTKRKYQCLIFASITLVAFSLPITGYIFNAFGQTNYRWLYIVHILMCGIFAIVIDYFIKRFYISSNRKNKRNLYIFISLISVSVLTNIIVNTRGFFFKETSITRSEGNKDDNWKDEFIKISEAQSFIKLPFKENMEKKSTNVYRFSNRNLTNINGRPENIGMINNQNPLNYWFSIVNNNAQSVVNSFEERDLNWRSYGFGTDIAFNTIFGVKYYMTSELVLDNPDYRLKDATTFKNKKWYLYENSKWSGLAYSVKEETFSNIKNSTNGLKKEINLLYQNIINDVVTNYSKDTFILSLEEPEDRILILSVPYNKNWKAYENGNEIKIDKSFDGLMAVEAKGRKVEFVYKNILVDVGLYGSLVSFACLIFLNKYYKL